MATKAEIEEAMADVTDALAACQDRHKKCVEWVESEIEKVEAEQLRFSHKSVYGQTLIARKMALGDFLVVLQSDMNPTEVQES